MRRIIPMARKTKKKDSPRWRTADEASKFSGLPILSEWTQCREVAADHWQGVKEDGTVVDVRGGPLRGCVLHVEDNIIRGVIRLTPALSSIGPAKTAA
jgi:hypothetical protein